MASCHQTSSIKQVDEDLRQQFVARVADASCSINDIATMFIFHPASIYKLRAAIGVLARSAARDSSTRDDLTAEARVQALLAFARHRDLNYDDKRGSFGSWLYVFWKNCLMQGVRPLGRRGSRIKYQSPDQLVHVPSPDSQAVEEASMHDLQELLGVIAQMPATRMREVMMDWAAGLSGADSARLRNISEPRICVLRDQGLEFIREKLNLEPPTPRP